MAGNGQLRTEQRAVGSLTALEMSGQVQVDVRVGQAASLQVEADSNLLPMVRTSASGDSLKVWVEGNVRTNNPIRVIYTVPQLSRIRGNGSGRLTVSELNGGSLVLSREGSGASRLSGKVGNLNLQLNGSGDVDASALQSGNTNLNIVGSGGVVLGQVNGESLNVKLRGSGDMHASGGTATQLNARVSGSGGVNLKGVSTQRADLATDGSGEISAQVTQALVAQATGSGRITVYGNPAQRSVTGKHVTFVN